MTKPLIDWYPEINPDIPDVPITGIIEAVRSAAIKFCEKTHLWAINLAEIDVVSGISAYTLTVPVAQYAEIVEVQNVKFKKDGDDEDQYQRVPQMSEVLNDLNSSAAWKYYGASAESKYSHYIDPVNKTTLVLVPKPDENSTDGLLVKVVLKPLRTATVLPDFLYNEHREDIGYGAKANLFGRRGMVWYDPNESANNMAKFWAACSNGKWKKVKGGTSTGQPHQVRMRPMV